MKPAFFLMIVGYALLEVAVLPFVQVFGAKPDLMLLCVFWVALEFPLYQALLISIYAAFVKDIFSASSWGLHMILFPLWVWVIKELSRKVTLENKTLRFVVLCMIILLHNILGCVLAAITGRGLASIGTIIRMTFSATFYSLLVFPLISHDMHYLGSKRRQPRYE